MLANDHPTAALLVPCYNAAEFLPELVASARRQARPFDQIICYDDGSKDGTAQRARELGIDVITSRENHGASFARNRLAEAATADFIHFHDADDAFHDDDFLRQMLESADDRTAGFCDWRRVSKGGEERRFEYGDTCDATDWIDFFIDRHVHLNALLFPRRFLIEAGCRFDECFRIQEDLLFNLSAAASGLRFTHCAQELAIHVRRCGSTLDGWDPLAVHSTSLELCSAAEGFLTGEHRRKLGEKAIYHSRQLLAAGAGWDVAARGAEVARRCGLERSDAGGFAERLLSRLFGHGIGLRYFHARSRFSKHAV